MAVDSVGNVIVVGTTKPWSAGSLDYATLKYDPQGNLLWARILDGANTDDAALDVAVDGANNVTVTGWSLVGSTYNAMTVSYDAAGNERWVRSYPTTGSGLTPSSFQKVRAALDGSITVTTQVWNGVDSDVAALRYASDGGLSWAWTLGGDLMSADTITSLAIDSSGRVTVAGSLWMENGGDDLVLAQFTGDPHPLRYNVVAPCRILDTRDPGLGGPSPFAARVTRTIKASGSCGIPETARALALNLTVTNATAPGNLRTFPGGFPAPNASNANYAPGQTRANNAVVGLGAGGHLGLLADQASGTVDVIVDVSGYFE